MVGNLGRRTSRGRESLKPRGHCRAFEHLKKDGGEGDRDNKIRLKKRPFKL
jgi:hypothetical protein